MLALFIYSYDLYSSSINPDALSTVLDTRSSVLRQDDRFKRATAHVMQNIFFPQMSQPNIQKIGISVVSLCARNDLAVEQKKQCEVQIKALEKTGVSVEQISQEALREGVLPSGMTLDVHSNAEDITALQARLSQELLKVDVLSEDAALKNYVNTMRVPAADTDPLLLAAANTADYFSNTNDFTLNDAIEGVNPISLPQDIEVPVVGSVSVIDVPVVSDVDAPQTVDIIPSFEDDSFSSNFENKTPARALAALSNPNTEEFLSVGDIPQEAVSVGGVGGSGFTAPTYVAPTVGGGSFNNPVNAAGVNAVESSSNGSSGGVVLDSAESLSDSGEALSGGSDAHALVNSSDGGASSGLSHTTGDSSVSGGAASQNSLSSEQTLGSSNSGSFVPEELLSSDPGNTGTVVSSENAPAPASNVGGSEVSALAESVVPVEEQAAEQVASLAANQAAAPFQIPPTDFTSEDLTIPPTNSNNVNPSEFLSQEVAERNANPPTPSDHDVRRTTDQVFFDNHQRLFENRERERIRQDAADYENQMRDRLAALDVPEERAEPVQVQEVVSPGDNSCAGKDGAELLKCRRCKGIKNLVTEYRDTVFNNSASNPENRQYCELLDNYAVGILKGEYPAPGKIDYLTYIGFIDGVNTQDLQTLHACLAELNLSYSIVNSSASKSFQSELEKAYESHVAQNRSADESQMICASFGKEDFSVEAQSYVAEQNSNTSRPVSSRSTVGHSNVSSRNPVPVQNYTVTVAPEVRPEPLPVDSGLNLPDPSLISVPIDTGIGFGDSFSMPDEAD